MRMVSLRFSYSILKKAEASREAVPPVTPLAAAPNPFARSVQPALPALPALKG